MFSTTKNISPWSYGIVKWNEYTPAKAYEHIIVCIITSRKRFKTLISRLLTFNDLILFFLQC